MEEENSNNNIEQKAFLFGDIFEYNSTTNRSKCLLSIESGKCSSNLFGCRPFNLIRHINSVHKDFKLKIVRNNAREITENSILNACVTTVTIDGRPFSTLKDLGFSFLLQNTISLLPAKSGKEFKVDIHKVQHHLKTIKEKMVERIILETKKHLVSAMMDTATKNYRSILGINIQYVLRGKIVVRSLAMNHLKQSHTAIHLANVVNETLEKFGMKTKQLYSMTTDNARNMILSQSILDDLSAIDQNEDGVVGNMNFEDIEEDFYHNLLIEAEKEFFESSDVAEYVNKLHCALHSFQLAINDAIQRCIGIKKLIDKCRDVVKKLRTPTIMNALKEKRLNFPVLDVPTRWLSKFNMVIDFL